MFQNSSTKPDKVNLLLGVRSTLLKFFVKSVALAPINTLLLAEKFNKDVQGCFYLKNNHKYSLIPSQMRGKMTRGEGVALRWSAIPMRDIENVYGNASRKVVLQVFTIMNLWNYF